MCVATNESFFMLRYLPETVSAAQESKEQMTEDGIEDAFEVKYTVHSNVSPERLRYNFTEHNPC